jgi:predicted TIM-barrel fold metal-dependent hydrolase
VLYLASGDLEMARAFLIHYQDRITYGTDFTLRPGVDEQQAAENLNATHERDWNYFASSGALTYNGNKTQGLGLPAAALKKIFRENAIRWFPGIA